MARTVFVVFLTLHGLVHLLYLGQAAKALELQPGLTWPAGSWALSRLLGDSTVRAIAIVLCAVTALVFVVGAAGLAINQTWWRSAAAAAASISTILFIAFWNGQVQRLDQQGAIGVLLNAAVLVATLVLRWPR